MFFLLEKPFENHSSKCLILQWPIRGMLSRASYPNINSLEVFSKLLLHITALAGLRIDLSLFLLNGSEFE